MKTDNKVMLELLERILLIRITEETIASRYNEGKMRCPTHLSIGQEAIAAAVGLSLRTTDFVLSTHRSHAHYLGKGGNLNKMISEIYGKSTGCSGGIGGSMHLIDKSVGFMGSTAIVGGTIPIAVGLGLSISLKKTDQISCIFFGDGAVEEGVFYESVNFAVIKNLPVLFICENNLYSVYSPLQVRQPVGRKIYEMVKGLGITTTFGDGNNVKEVYSKVSDAITKIRNGEGPHFLEFSTYRWLEHCGPEYDNHIGYRSESEFLTWKEKDPVKQFERFLLSNNIIDEKQLVQIKIKTETLVNEAFKFAEESPFPEFEKLQSYVYSK